MRAVPVPDVPVATVGATAAAEWVEVANAAPLLAKTMRRYLAQVATFLAPTSVDVADNTLRQLARWLIEATAVRAVADITRDDIEDFKIRLASAANASRPAPTGNGCGRCERSSNGSSSGSGTTPPAGTRCSVVTSRPVPNRSPSSSMTPTPPSSWPPPEPPPTHGPGSS